MRRESLGIALLTTMALAAAAAAQAPPDGDGPWVLRAYGWTDGTLRKIGDDFEHFAVFEEKGFLVIQADDRNELALLAAAGLRLEVDEKQTATLRLIETYRAAGLGLDSIPGFECYRTVEETLATGAALAAANPDLATWIDIGDSWEKINLPPAGYDLRVLRLTSSAVAGDKPALMVLGSIHPREYATAELVTRFAESLLDGYGIDADATWILDHHEVHLMLVTNPDGRQRAETGLSWRKNADNDFCTDSDSRGIDLNRNFDFEWGCCGGSSGSECDLTFRGPSAASEPETQAVQDYVTALFPDQRPDDLTTPAPADAEGIFLDVHAFGQVVLSPWSFTATDPPNGPGILTLARKYAFFPGYDAQLGSFGTVDGSTKDFIYGRLGVPGYTVELGTTFFQDCASFENTILPDNLPALLHTAKNVRAPYVTPSGPDTVDPTVTPLPVTAGTLVDLTATIDDTRYDGAEPMQAIASAEAWIDVPPWTEGTPIALAASDGAFDEPVESVEATIDTTGLTPGRHTLFVQGEDATSTFGAVSAEFLYVIDPVSAPTIEGTVRDAVSGVPLHADLTIGPFQIQSAPATGTYSLQLPSGTYDVTATHDGYAPALVEGVVASDFQTLELDLFLQPLVEFFNDDVETGNAGWTAEAPWAITEEASNSPTHSWTDSPGGNYADNADTSLTSPVFDLSEMNNAVLRFVHLYDFESTLDFGLVEVSTDGSAWATVASFSQEQTAEWIPEEIPLPMLDGAAAARIRFRVTSDESIPLDGWHVDDIRLQAAGTGSASPIFADGFETGDTTVWSGSVP